MRLRFIPRQTFRFRSHIDSPERHGTDSSAERTVPERGVDVAPVVTRFGAPRAARVRGSSAFDGISRVWEEAGEPDPTEAELEEDDYLGTASTPAGSAGPSSPSPRPGRNKDLRIPRPSMESFRKEAKAPRKLPPE